MQSALGVTSQEWKSSGAKYGWALRLLVKKRAILYLGPCQGCFRVSLVLGDRAMLAARQSKPSKGLLKLLDEAPHYPEGTAIRLIVHGVRELAAVRKLALIKLDN